MNKDLSIKIFNELLSVLEINTNELARALGMKRAQGLYDILNPNKNVGISKNMAEKISNVFPKINKLYLLTGSGNILVDSEISNKSGDFNDIISDYIKLLEEKNNEIKELYKQIGRLELENEQLKNYSTGAVGNNIPAVRSRKIIDPVHAQP